MNYTSCYSNNTKEFQLCKIKTLNWRESSCFRSYYLIFAKFQYIHGITFVRKIRFYIFCFKILRKTVLDVLEIYLSTFGIEVAKKHCQNLRSNFSL